MGKYCRFCKELGHRKDTCSKRPVDKRQCFTCGKKGHFALRCPRGATLVSNDVTGAKRTRISNKKTTEGNHTPFVHGPSGSNASIHAPTTASSAKIAEVVDLSTPPVENTSQFTQETGNSSHTGKDADMHDASAGNYNHTLEPNTTELPSLLPNLNSNSLSNSNTKTKKKSPSASPYRVSDRLNKGQGPERMSI